MNKDTLDLRKEEETTMKSQRQTQRDIENLGKKTEVMYISINNRIQEIEEKISVTEDIIESIDKTVENAKCKNLQNQTIQEIQYKMRRPSLMIISIEECEDF